MLDLFTALNEVHDGVFHTQMGRRSLFYTDSLILDNQLQRSEASAHAFGGSRVTGLYTAPGKHLDETMVAFFSFSLSLPAFFLLDGSDSEIKTGSCFKIKK